jgi:16S rRNA C967 or C1407 C5-methylase (RsmB/RsmF family)
MGKRSKPTGSELFDIYYRTLFGNRWGVLKEALLKERSPVPFSNGLQVPYYLDEASVLAANLLPVKEGDSVLDMCAAPGGKTLVIASRLHGTGRLVSNDRSAERRNRLLKVTRECINPAWLDTITVTGHDASKWGLYETLAYDAVLLDAPCSSERHVAVSQSALSQWSPSRPKRLAIAQFAFLCSALEAVKVGGTILYCTCAITPEEDEDVVAKLFVKREGRFSLPQFDVPYAESRPYGKIIMPDTADGRGPLYVCLIRRER